MTEQMKSDAIFKAVEAVEKMSYTCPLREMISDDELQRVFTGTNFGAGHTPRQIVAETVLKIGSGYHTGNTALVCCQELGLVGKNKIHPQLTKRGQEYMFWSHKGAPDKADTSIADELAKALKQVSLTGQGKNADHWYCPVCACHSKWDYEMEHQGHCYIGQALNKYNAMKDGK